MEVTTIPATIDLDALLAPIAGDNPAGELLQYSGVYDEIREARRQDDDFLAQGSWQRELKVADWRKVVTVSTSALTAQTKDLQIAVWLAEALVKQHGFAGLRDSLRLVRGLHEQFWANFYPEIDEDNDMEARANALEFMDRQTALAIKEIALTGNNLNFNHLEESRNFDIPADIETLEYAQQERYTALAKQAADEKRTTGEVWRKGKATTKRQFYEPLWLTIEECWSDFSELDSTIDRCFGNQTPGLNQLKKSLDAVRDAVKKVLLEKREQEPDPSDAATAISSGAESNGGGGGNQAAESNGGATIGYQIAATSGAIRSRQDALKRLSEVSDFFRQTEPHSPIYYLVQRAVKWGNMPLESWLQDVIKDDTVLEQIRETLGFNTNSANGDAEAE